MGSRGLMRQHVLGCTCDGCQKNGRDGHHYTCSCVICSDRAKRKRRAGVTACAPTYVTPPELLPVHPPTEHGKRRQLSGESMVKASTLIAAAPVAMNEGTPIYKLFIICGFQGGGLADVPVAEALQKMYSTVRFQLIGGWSFEIDKAAVSMSEKIQTPVRLEPKGGINLLPGLVKRLRIGPETIVFAYGGSPCQRVSKGIMFQRDDTSMVGPHQEPSNLFWTWQGALSTLTRVNGNRYQDVASLSEMVEPALDAW